MIGSDDLEKVIFEIESFESQKINSRIEAFELNPDPMLLSNLSGYCGALLIRAILRELNINEHHVFRWRLENKYRQYQILDYYVPGCMPKTLAFSKLLNQSNGIQQIKELFLKGFFLKSTLGDASFFTKSWDKTAEFDHILKLNNLLSDNYESYVLQRKLDLKCEFRIHTFCKDIIPFLTYLVRGYKPSDNYSRLKEFVNEVLQKLPDVILQGTFIAWDIGLTSEDEYYVIEANFTGFHPEYRAGFQTSGYVDEYPFGPIICAWLNIFFSKKYGIYINSVESSLLECYPFYDSFVFYMSIFKKEHIDIIKNVAKGDPISAIMYLGEETNIAIVRLIKHFLLVSYAEIYYVIVRDECLLSAKNLFLQSDQIKVLSEHELFTKDQHQLIKHLDYDRRKQICCYHVVRKLNNKFYIII